MKSIKSLVFIFLILLMACNPRPNNKQTSEQSEAGGTIDVILVDDLLKDPETYVGKVVELEGLVTHVCKHSGKRLHLTSTASNDMIRVEATGDIRQFERELEGSDVTITGKVQKLVVDEDYLAKWENELSANTESHDHSQSEEETEQLNNLRARLEQSGQDQLISYWVDGTSFKVN